MKEKIAGIITFAMSSLFVIFSLASISKGDIENLREALIMVAFLTFFVSNILYIVWTKFGKH